MLTKGKSPLSKLRGPLKSSFTSYHQHRQGFTEIKQIASGQWLWILETLAPQLRPAVEAHTRSKSRHTPCPIHGGKDGFRLYNNAAETGGGRCNTCLDFSDGFALLGWANGWQPSQCLQEVRSLLQGYQPSLEPIQYVASIEEPATGWDTRHQNYWDEGIPGNEAEPVRRYIASRGLADVLDNWPATLKYRPMWLRETEALTPCLISLVQSPDGSPATLHRLFLTMDGQKALGPDSKRLLSSPGRGYAIRLYDPPEASVLNVAEGIETAFAVSLAHPGESTWAGVTAGGLAGMAIPERFHTVRIWGDNDSGGAGQRAAQSLKDRYASNRELSVLIPPVAGSDWLDEFVGVTGSV